MEKGSLNYFSTGKKLLKNFKKYEKITSFDKYISD